MPFSQTETPRTLSYLDTTTTMKPCIHPTIDTTTDIISRVAPLSFDEMLSGRNSGQASLRKVIRDRLDNVSPIPHSPTSPCSPSAMTFPLSPPLSACNSSSTSCSNFLAAPNFDEGRKRAYSAPSVLNLPGILTPIQEEEEEVAITSNMLSAAPLHRKLPETREHRSNSDAALMPRYRKMNPSSPLSGRVSSKPKDRKPSTPESP